MTKLSLVEALDQALGTPTINFKILYKLLYAMIMNDTFKDGAIDLDSDLLMPSGKTNEVMRPDDEAIGVDGLNKIDKDDGQLEKERALDEAHTHSPTTDAVALNEESMVADPKDDVASYGNAVENSESILKKHPDPGTDESEATAEIPNQSNANTNSVLLHGEELQTAESQNKQGNADSSSSPTVASTDQSEHDQLSAVATESDKHPMEIPVSTSQSDGSSQTQISEAVQNEPGMPTIATQDPKHIQETITNSVQSEIQNCIIPKFADLETQLNALNDSVGDTLKAFESTQQESVARLQAIENKNILYEESLKILTKMSEDGVIDKLQTSQTALDTEICEVRKEMNRVLNANNETLIQLTEIDGNSRGFYSKVNRMIEQIADISNKLEYSLTKYELQVRWNQATKGDIETLKETKADLKAMEEALATKGDQTELDLKASIDSLEHTKEELMGLLQHLDDDLTNKYTELDNKINSNCSELNTNVLTMNNEFKARIACLKHVIGEIKKHLACDALASTSMFLKDRACLSCKTDACMRSELCYPLVPKLKPIGSIKSKCGRGNPHGHPGVFDDFVREPAPYVHRFSGGNHTITGPATKVFHKGHFLNEYPDAIPKPFSEKSFKHGTDGNIYVIDNC